MSRVIGPKVCAHPRILVSYVPHPSLNGAKQQMIQCLRCGVLHVGKPMTIVAGKDGRGWDWIKPPLHFLEKKFT